MHPRHPPSLGCRHPDRSMHPGTPHPWTQASRTPPPSPGPRHPGPPTQRPRCPGTPPLWHPGVWDPPTLKDPGVQTPHPRIQASGTPPPQGPRCPGTPPTHGPSCWGVPPPIRVLTGDEGARRHLAVVGPSRGEGSGRGGPKGAPIALGGGIGPRREGLERQGHCCHPPPHPTGCHQDGGRRFRKGPIGVPTGGTSPCVPRAEGAPKTGMSPRGWPRGRVSPVWVPKAGR